MKHDNNFDLLRLFAASDVMLSHAIEHLKLPVPPWIIEALNSFPGVPIFFVISGFLITETFFKRDGALSPYLTNRALRIYPAMWLNLILIALMMLAFGVVTLQTFLGPRFAAWMLPLLATGSWTITEPILRHVPHLWNSQLPFWPGGALWTIIVEIGFYLMVPLVFAGPFRRWRALALLSLASWAAASYAFDVYLIGHPNRFLSTASPFPYFWVFAIGAASYLTWPWIRFWIEGRAFVWIAIFVAACLWLRQSRGLTVPDYQNPGLITTGLVLLLAGVTLSSAFSARALAMRLLHKNDISYGVYLHHMPVVMLFIAAGYTGTLYALPAFLATTILTAVASWVLIERQALAFKIHA